MEIARCGGIICLVLLLSGCCTCPRDERDAIRRQDIRIDRIIEKMDSVGKAVDDLKYGPYSPFNMDGGKWGK